MSDDSQQCIDGTNSSSVWTPPANAEVPVMGASNDGTGGASRGSGQDGASTDGGPNWGKAISEVAKTGLDVLSYPGKLAAKVANGVDNVAGALGASDAMRDGIQVGTDLLRIPTEGLTMLKDGLSGGSPMEDSIQGKHGSFWGMLGQIGDVGGNLARGDKDGALAATGNLDKTAIGRTISRLGNWAMGDKGPPPATPASSPSAPSGESS